MRLKQHITLFLLIIGGLLLFACSSEEPIRVIITPTPAEATETETPFPSPPPPMTNTPAAAAESTQPVPTVRGAIIGPGYELPTLPPPTVVIPTVTPTPEEPEATPTVTNTPGPTNTPVARLDAAQMGIQLYTNVEFDEWRAVIDGARTTGVRWMKVQVNWAELQPSGPNEWGDRFALFERQIEWAKSQGFEVLLSIAKAPAWARSTVEEAGPPDDPQLLANFINLLLNTKIGPATSAVEVWNEPNLIREWRGSLPFNGTGYMRLFEPAYEAIRSYNPALTVITAGLAPTASLDGISVDDRLFLQQMYDAGLGNYTDNVAIGVHPYGWGNPPDARCCDLGQERGWDDDPRFFFLDTLEAYYDIMQRNGHGSLQLWATEFGWATWEGLGSEPPEEWITYNTATEQANYALRAFEIGQALDYVGPMILWNLNFANVTRVENREEVTAYSVINPALPVRERLLYWALGWATGNVQQPPDTLIP